MWHAKVVHGQKNYNKSPEIITMNILYHFVSVVIEVFRSFFSFNLSSPLLLDLKLLYSLLFQNDILLAELIGKQLIVYLREYYGIL